MGSVLAMVPTHLLLEWNVVGARGYVLAMSPSDLSLVGSA